MKPKTTMNSTDPDIRGSWPAVIARFKFKIANPKSHHSDSIIADDLLLMPLELANAYHS